MNGYGDRFLRVNLSNGKISKEGISDSMKRDFLGGRGFAIKLLWDEVRMWTLFPRRTSSSLPSVP